MKTVSVPCSLGIPEPGVAASPLTDAKKHGMTSLVQCVPHHTVQLYHEKIVHEQANSGIELKYVTVEPAQQNSQLAYGTSPFSRSQSPTRQM